MNEGIHLDLDTWIVPGQIRKANLCRGLGNRYTPAGTEVLTTGWDNKAVAVAVMWCVAVAAAVVWCVAIAFHFSSPMHSFSESRLWHLGQSASPHSFFWRQKWQVMPTQRASS